MSADFYITVRYRVNSLWDHNDKDCTDENIKRLIRDEHISGLVEDEYEITEIERIP